MNESVWNSVLAEIEVSVSHASFVTWFRNTALQDDGDDKVTVLVPNIFAKQQLEVKFNDTIKSLLKRMALKPVRFLTQFRLHHLQKRNMSQKSIRMT
jgi:chromosomal replication initiation ATPase DnaA